MKKFNYINILSVLFALFLISSVLISCDDKEATTPNDSKEELFDPSSLNLPYAPGMTRADNIPDLPPLDPIQPVEDGDAVIDAIFNNIQGVIINRTKVYNTGFVFDELSIFSPIENQIFPANVFVGSSIPNGKFINLPNHTVGEITWSAKGLVPINNTDTFAYDATNPKASTFNVVTQGWFATPTQPLASTTTFDLNEVSTSKEIGVKLGVGFDTDDISAKLNLSGRHEKMKTHVLVKAVQKAFSIAMDLPQGSILKTARIEDMGGVMPVYVSEVFYGRIGYAIISSEHEYHEVVAALNLNIPTDNINIEIENSYKEILDAAATSQYIIGGSSEEHGQTIDKGWEGFKDALSAPLTPATARPVAYVLRYVHDNSVARVVLSGNYTLNESYFIPDVDKLTIDFTPLTARAKAGPRRPICLFGEASIKLANDNKWQKLFSKASREYILLENGTTETEIQGAATTSISLERPFGMPMKEFLKQKVNIKAEFYNSDVNGTRALDNLGSTEYTVTVKDLLFSALNGKSNIYTKQNGRQEFEANIVLKIDVKTDIKRLNNRYGE